MTDEISVGRRDVITGPFTRTPDEERRALEDHIQNLRQEGVTMFGTWDIRNVLRDIGRSRSWGYRELERMAAEGKLTKSPSSSFYEFPGVTDEERHDHLMKAIRDLKGNRYQKVPSQRTHRQFVHRLAYSVVQAVFYLNMVFAGFLAASLVPGDSVNTNVAGTFALLGLTVLFDAGILLPAWLLLHRTSR